MDLNESFNFQISSILGRRGDMRNDGVLAFVCCLIYFAFNLGLTLLNLTPELNDSMLFIFIYSNLEKDKAKIYSDNKGKSGVYCFKNKINGSVYVGSSVDLKKRFKYYFSVNYLRSETLRCKSKIYSSLLKNGYENFILEILEHCDPDQCIETEDYYINLFKPDYNICPKAGSSFGRTTSEDTKMKLSIIALNRKHIPVPGFQVQVTDLDTNETITYDSIRVTAAALNSDIKTILRREQNNITKPYRDRYIINIIRD